MEEVWCLRCCIRKLISQGKTSQDYLLKPLVNRETYLSMYILRILWTSMEKHGNPKPKRWLEMTYQN